MKYEAPDPASVSAPTLEAVEVSKWFGQKAAISDITCSFGAGITGLLGPNGAGKTTLLRMLAGLLNPSNGSIRVFGKAPRAAVDIYRQVGLVPEEDAVYPHLSARQFITLAGRLSGVANPKAATESVLEMVDLTADADRPIAGYSKGMRQRAKVAAALVHNPSLLILDEPLNGTDPVQRARLITIFKQLADNGKTVIVSSHVLQEVERMTDRVIAVVDGKLAAAGNVTAIRSAMTDIPYQVEIIADDPRALAKELLAVETVNGVTLDGHRLIVATEDLHTLGSITLKIAQVLDVRITGFRPSDESLESVFRYLVNKR